MTNKEERKEVWMKKNSYLSQLLLHNLVPMNPELGFYMRVDGIDISNDFFEDEYNQICDAYQSVLSKMNEYYKSSRLEEEK